MHRLKIENYIKRTHTKGFVRERGQDRLRRHTHQITIGNVVGPIELLAFYDYNSMGQMISKRVGGPPLGELEGVFTSMDFGLYNEAGL